MRKMSTKRPGDSAKTGHRGGPVKLRYRLRSGARTPEKTRILVLLLCQMLQRLERLRRELYGGDLDLASITEAIGLSAVEVQARNANWLEEYGDLKRVVD